MLAVNQENEKLMEEYEKLASEVRLGLRGPPPLPYLCSPNPALPLLPTQLSPGLDLQSLPLLRVAVASPSLLLPSLPTPCPLPPTQAPVIHSSSIQLLVHFSIHSSLASLLALCALPTYTGPWTQKLTILLLP